MLTPLKRVLVKERVWAAAMWLLIGCALTTTVQAATEGQLAAQLTTPAAGSTVNLTAEGTADWAHWGLTGATSVNRKRSVTARIGNVAVVNGGTLVGRSGGPIRNFYTWTDGAPVSGSSTKTFVGVEELGKGVQLTAVADAVQRTLAVYIGGFKSRGTLEVSLSDGSAAPFTATAGDLTKGFEQRLSVTYRSASPGQSVIVRWTSVEESAIDSEVSIGAATLQEAPEGGGQLMSVLTTPAAGSTVSLTAEGTADWAHWGLTGATSVNRKSGVTPQIGGLTPLNGGALVRSVGGSIRNLYAWSDGTPTASSSTKAFVQVTGIGKGLEVTASADTNERTLVVYLNGWMSQGRVEVSLSDGSAPSFSTTGGDLTMGYERRLAVTYRAASAGQTLSVRWLQEAGTGEVSIGAATLQGAAAPDIPLPFSDDFGGGNVNGWQFFDQTDAPSSWSFTQGALVQDARVIGSPSSTLSGTYRQGTLGFLGNGFGLTDYRFSVDAESLTIGLAEDVGVLFRYRDPNNFYRLSISSRFGFTRLEKRVNGVYGPLATDSRGYRRGEVINLEVELRGTQILVRRNGDPLFAVADGSHSNGTIGFYTQDKARFDNVRIDPPSQAPALVVSSPLAYLTTSGTSIRAGAMTLNAPEGSAVEFSLNGAVSVVDSVAPYEAEIPGLAVGNYEVTARLLDGSGAELARDTNPVVGVGGEYLVGVGDSITNGIGDFFAADNASALERIIGFQGYEAVLTDLLDETSPTPTNLVFNEGIGGDTSYNAAYSRVDSIKDRHREMDTALTMLGTNDANQLIPSGLGCVGTSCNGTFKQNMQALVDKLAASGVTPVVALPPPAFNSTAPYTSATNNRIRDYISVIENELTGIALGPDFFNFFMPSATESYRTLFSDTLHPNSLGYRVMSYLWHNALSPASQRPLPFILRNLSLSTGQPAQQSLLGVGNAYYIDEIFTLAEFPAFLTEGRWIMTANADRNSTAASYASFEVDRDVDVYVAYDAGAGIPEWLSGFLDTGETITTNNPNTPILRLHRQSFNVAGDTVSVTLGGNNGLSTGADVNYVVIVVEQPE